MEFLKAIKNIQNKKNRRSGVKAYYSSGKVFFSRLFGYERKGDQYQSIPKFANAIKLIFQLLINGSSLPEIKQRLDNDGYRDGSNNRYSLDRICSVVRPVYAAYIKQGLSYRKITNIEAIVSLDNYKAAKKQLDQERKRLIMQ